MNLENRKDKPKAKCKVRLVKLNTKINRTASSRRGNRRRKRSLHQIKGVLIYFAPAVDGKQHGPLTAIGEIIGLMMEPAPTNHVVFHYRTSTNTLGRVSLSCTVPHYDSLNIARFYRLQSHHITISDCRRLSPYTGEVLGTQLKETRTRQALTLYYQTVRRTLTQTSQKNGGGGAVHEYVNKKEDSVSSTTVYPQQQNKTKNSNNYCK